MAEQPTRKQPQCSKDNKKIHVLRGSDQYKTRENVRMRMNVSCRRVRCLDQCTASEVLNRRDADRDSGHLFLKVEECKRLFDDKQLKVEASSKGLMKGPVTMKERDLYTH